MICCFTERSTPPLVTTPRISLEFTCCISVSERRRRFAYRNVVISTQSMWQETFQTHSKITVHDHDVLKASKIIFHLSRNLSRFQGQIKASRRYILSTQLSALSSEIRLNPQLSKQKNTVNVGQIWIHYSRPLVHWWRSQILTCVKQIPVIFLYQIML